MPVRRRDKWIRAWALASSWGLDEIELRDWCLRHGIELVTDDDGEAFVAPAVFALYRCGKIVDDDPVYRANLLDRLAARAAKGGRERVYVVRMIGTAAVKIGVTRNVARRLFDLQDRVPYPLRVLWAFPGGFEEEAAIHKIFARLRLSGEWFIYSDALRNFVLDGKARICF